MTTDAPVLQPPAVALEDDSLGIDREFAIKMAQMPVLALLWVAAALVSHQLWAAVAPAGLNAGPLVVLCFGMILAAFIDGWCLKVPNWVTLPLILSGWMLGILHNYGVAVDAGTGGFGMAFFGTVFGFLLLFPMLAIGGVGEGDVKMQMGFGAWVGAFFGDGAVTVAAGMSSELPASRVILCAFATGAIVGGIFAMAMILMRRNWGANAKMFKEIGRDLEMFATGKSEQAGKRAQERRKVWEKLPYGIPLCVGFLMYLAYALILVG